MSRSLLYLLGLVIGLAAACQSQPATRSAMSVSPPTRFELSASPGCANGYPATILEARFITPDGGSFPVPYGHFLEGDWGGSAIGWAVGDERQPAPDSLEIRWFSYTENKFYEGHFLLPQAHIYALLKQGFWQADQHKQATYDDLSLSVVPGGVVVVWLTGQQNQVLVGRYQAREINYPFEKLAPGVERVATVREEQAKLAPEVQHEIASGTLSSRKWDDYLRTYSWQLGLSQPITLQGISISYLDAESINDPPTPDAAAFAHTFTAPAARPVPKSLTLLVAGAYGRQARLRVSDFAEAEVQHAFQALHTQHPHEALTLYVELDERLTKATLSLRAGDQVVPLPHCPVKLFGL